MSKESYLNLLDGAIDGFKVCSSSYIVLSPKVSKILGDIDSYRGLLIRINLKIEEDGFYLVH